MFKIGDKVVRNKEAVHSNECLFAYGVNESGVVTYVNGTNLIVRYSNGKECQFGHSPSEYKLEKVGNMKYQVGDKFFRNDNHERYTEEVLAVVEHNDRAYYVTVDEDDCVEVVEEDTLDEYRKQGDVQELTLEQIAKKLNIPVKNLRIKD